MFESLDLNRSDGVEAEGVGAADDFEQAAGGVGAGVLVGVSPFSGLIQNPPAIVATLAVAVFVSGATPQTIASFKKTARKLGN